MAVVKFENVSRVYKSGDHELKALDSVNMELEEGKFVVILGPSGAGKSTLLNLLGGLDSPTDGKIYVEGEDISKLSNDELADYRAKKVGFVFQFYNLVPDLTIKENIEVTAHLSTNPLNVDDLLRSLGLYEHRNKFPRQVSGGQQQRCAIGRALVKNPGLLLCDEPTGALDYKTSKEILQLMEDVNHEYGCTIIIVTHNMQQATRVADNTAFFLLGEVVEYAETEKMFSKPADKRTEDYITGRFG